MPAALVVVPETTVFWFKRIGNPYEYGQVFSVFMAPGGIETALA